MHLDKADGETLKKWNQFINFMKKQKKFEEFTE
jgi:hypothetical protein